LKGLFCCFKGFCHKREGRVGVLGLDQSITTNRENN
jgi:hypothetical protein